MKKVALFVFNGDPVCFIHVLLNGLDMQAKGMEGKIIVEGAATALLPKLAEETHPLHKLWEKAKAQGIVDGVCKAAPTKWALPTKRSDRGCPCLTTCPVIRPCPVTWRPASR